MAQKQLPEICGRSGLAAVGVAMTGARGACCLKNLRGGDAFFAYRAARS